jgi:hypothetical protein
MSHDPRSRRPAVDPVERRKAFVEDYIGGMAVSSMLCVVLFAMLQFVAWIPVALLVLFLPGIVGEKAANAAGGVCAVVIQFGALGYMILRTRRAFPPVESVDFAEYEKSFEGRRPSPFTERHLEAAIAATAGGAILWVLVMGMGAQAARVALGVIEGFAILFMTVFLNVRWHATGEVRPTAVAALGMSIVSLWKLVSNLHF